MADNIAQSIIIIGASYLTLVEGMNPLLWWIMIIACLFTWQQPAVTDEIKEFYIQQARYYQLRSDKLKKELNKK